MPSTEHGRESPVPPRTLPTYQGLGLLEWRPLYMAWQPSWNRGSGSSPTPKTSFLSSCSCLPRMPASSPLSFQPSLEFQSTDGVQEGGWVEAKPAPPPNTFTLVGAGTMRNPVKKSPLLEDMWPRQRKHLFRKPAKKMEVVFTQDHCAWDAGWKQRAL